MLSLTINVDLNIKLLYNIELKIDITLYWAVKITLYQNVKRSVVKSIQYIVQWLNNFQYISNYISPAFYITDIFTRNTGTSERFDP